MIISPQDCCRPCDDNTTTNIPGPQGDPGTPGTNGTNGINAYTTVTIPFIMPALAGTVTVDVAVASWAVVGQKVAIGLEGSAAFGTFQVVSIVGPTQLLLQNISTGTTATDSYADNSAPGTLFPSALQVGPSGLQGPQGPGGATGAPDDATYLVQTANGSLPNAQNMDALATGLVKNTTGTGVQSIVALGVGNTNVAPVDNGGGLTNGNAVFGTAAGLETKTAAAARTALGLVIGTANTNIPPVDDASGLTSGEILRATANGIESVSDATIRAQLGLSGGVGAWLVFRYEEASSTDGASISQGAWRKVGLNTEVVDTGGDGTVAVGVVTLTAGTYRARWQVTGWECENISSRLYGVTAVAPLGYGTNGRSAATDTQAITIGECRFTVGAAGQVQLEVQVQLTNIYGKANGFGGPEIYACLELEKEL